MSAIKKLFFAATIVAGLLMLSSIQIQAQVPDEIIQSFKTGDSKALSEFFNQNIELVVLENDNVYSKAQAQQIVSKFFDENPPEKFNVIHQGGKEGAQYVIGSLDTNGKSFRIYFLLKKNGPQDYIHQLRIEEQ